MALNNMNIVNIQRKIYDESNAGGGSFDWKPPIKFNTSYPVGNRNFPT